MKKQNEKTAKTVKLTPAEAAAKHIAAVQAKKDAEAAMLADAAAGNESTIDATKPAKIIRSKAAETPPTIEELHAMAASEAAANSRENLKKPANKPPVAPVKAAETADNKPKVEKTVEPSAKEKKAAARVEYVRKAAELAIKAGYNTPQDIVYRNKAEDVKAGDVVVYHTKTGFSQFLQVEYISKHGTLTLEVAQDDALKQRAGSAGAWTKESWDVDRIQNVFSKRGGHDKFLQVVFFGKK